MHDTPKTTSMQVLPQVNVTIIADRFGAETTSDGAAGLWEVTLEVLALK